MNKTELKKLLAAGEWNDVEFKEARSSVPRSAYETVTAFANTHGGHLVFGVAQRDNAFEITGIETPDKVQNDFLSVLHADAKINHDVAVREQRFTIDGKEVLVFHVAENPRTRKPVYLDGDIRRTFLRKGGGDYKASDLMKAMFGAEPSTQLPTQLPTRSSDPVKAQEAQEAQVDLPKWQLSILAACATGDQTGKQLLEAAGYKTRTGNFKKGLQRLVEQQLIEYTIPDRPNSRMQKYRLTGKGRHVLGAESATEDAGGNR